MDHADWVERNNAAGRRLAAKRKPKRSERGRLIGYCAAPETLTPFQAKTMDILGMVYGGIYNAPINWETVDWNHGGGVSVIAHAGIGWSTFDYDYLTHFVFLCHEARIRGQISNAGMRHWRISFWQRSSVGGGPSLRHPNLNEAVAAFRSDLPSDHRVIYRDEQILEEART